MHVRPRRVVDFFGADAGGDVLGQIDQHRAGAAAGGDEEGFVDDARQIVDVLDQVIPLGAGAGDAGDVGFLEGVVADDLGGDLAAEDEDGDGVHLGGGQRGDGVGGAGAAGDDADAGLAGGAGVAVGTVAGALLVAVEDELGRGFVELVEDREDRSAGIAEHDFHLVLLDEHFVEDLRAGLALILGLSGCGSDFGLGLQRCHG